MVNLSSLWDEGIILPAIACRWGDPAGGGLTDAVLIAQTWEWLGPGGLPGLQNLWRVALRAAVGSTPIHSRLSQENFPVSAELYILTLTPGCRSRLSINGLHQGSTIGLVDKNDFTYF
jgi:hypothetical protein